MSEPSLDASLASGLKGARKATQEKPHFFAMVVKGPTAGLLIVSRKKIPPKQIADAKKDVGGTTVVKGVCYAGEDGHTQFETSKPPVPAWEALARRLARDLAGLSIKPVFVQGRNDEAVAEGSEDPDVDSGKTAEVLPSHPKAPDAPGIPDTLAARFAALAPALKAALAAKGPEVARIQSLALAINGVIKSGNAAQGSQALDELGSLLAPQASATPSPSADGLAELVSLGPLIQKALAAQPGKKDAILQVVARIKADAQAGKTDAVAAALAALRKVVGADTSPGRTPVDSQAVRTGREAYLAAKEAVGVDLNGLQVALRDLGEPRFARVADAGLNGITGKLQVGLEVALLNLIASGGSDAAARTKALSLVAEFRQFVTTDPIVQLCDTNPFGVAVGIRAKLVPALDVVEQSLA